MRRFVIAADGLSREKEAAFAAFLGARGGWWHWISNFWLFVTSDSALTVDQIRVQLGHLDATRMIVMEVPPDFTWTTQGTPRADGKQMGDWLLTVWDADRIDRTPQLPTK
jgi:hypothetical protein